MENQWDDFAPLKPEERSQLMRDHERTTHIEHGMHTAELLRPMCLTCETDWPCRPLRALIQLSQAERLLVLKAEEHSKVLKALEAYSVKGTVATSGRTVKVEVVVDAEAFCLAGTGVATQTMMRLHQELEKLARR